MISALRSGARLVFGTDHAGYPDQVEVPPETQSALCEDFD
jgi:hypothetical protein